MKSLLGVCFIIASLAFVEGQQRVAPGVPPQQYQQQYSPPQQHQQMQPQQHQQMQPQQHQQMQTQQQQQIPNQVPQMQQQVQYQQVPVQQQQVPQQHIPVQQQVPQQQVPQQHIPVQQQVPVQPQQGDHHGHHGHHQQQILNAANIMQEKEHIQEHIDIPMDISKMTEQELQFHYFKMHDADRNDKLDGCELIKSLIHWHGEENPSTSEDGPQPHTDEELESMVDGILSKLDANRDGFIDFIEFKSAND